MADATENVIDLAEMRKRRRPSLAGSSIGDPTQIGSLY
jgi:hypothetical protein